MLRLLRNIGIVLAFGLAFVLALLVVAFVVVLGISFVTWDWNVFADAFLNIEWQNIRFIFLLGCFVGILVWIFE